MTDLLRRAGDFDSAREICETALASADGFLADLLRFELDLIAEGDVDVHTLDDVPGVSV